jgi:hypothetical protein
VTLGGSGGAAGTGGAGLSGPTRGTISGDATWTVTFDATAQAAGATNCSYTRHYQGVEDQSAPWLCPQCQITFRASVQMTAGAQDCFPQVSTTPAATEEWLGYGSGKWWRGQGGPASEQGTAAVDGAGVTWANTVQDLEAPMGGTLGFDVAGTFTIGDEQGDPMNGWVVAGSYQCGWPKAGPPAYDGDYLLVRDAAVPDGIFKDSCQEVVRLHDFAGDYWLVNMSAVDCPACRGMAADEEQFVTTMQGHGIKVWVITLLAPALDEPWGETTKTMIDSWIDDFSLTSPVLGDRGWGLAMFIPTLGEQTAYPGWILVRPDMTVLDFGAGYSSFSDFENAILADAP